MKVLYDHQMFSIQKYGGITRYFCELMQNITINYELAFLLSENYYLRQIRTLFKGKLFFDSDFKGKRHVVPFFNKMYSLYQIRKNQYELFHPTFYDQYFLTSLKKPFVITVHDLIEFRYPRHNAYSDYIRPNMEKVIKRADRLIAISEHTKNDIVEFFDIDPEKIDVIYHGYNEPSSITTQNRFGRYILFVGHRNAYKNFSICLEALAPLLNSENDLKLICVGEPFSTEEYALINRLNVKEEVKAMQVSDATLNELYTHAQLFIYPSLYEGFGMPLLEAFVNNCPVCISNSSCFPEIAGDAGMYFDPLDAGSILKAVKEVLFDQQTADRLRQAGKKRLRHFSWKKAAEQTVQTYERTLQK